MGAQRKILTDGRLATLIVVAILLIDQAIKIWVKTSMTLHESIHITDWFYITFIENMGMAFGMQLGSKIVLSLFRVVAIAVLGYYIWLEVGKKARTGYIVCLSMVLAGAAGNLIDCMFYGLIFNNSSEFYLSYFVPFYFTWVLVEVFSAVLRGVGDALVPVLLIGVGICLFRILWILTVFAHFGTLFSLCLSYTVSWTITSIALTVYYKKGGWMKRRRIVDR